METIRIGTRGSQLALWQANKIAADLTALGHQSEIIVIKTQGDKIQNLSFEKLEGKGFFTKEIEEALLAEKVDLAVHSLKDLPTLSPDALCLAALSAREDPADILIYNEDVHDEKQILNLAQGIRLGSSSARRKMQVYAGRPDIQLFDLRGNVPTRLNKLRNKEVDAILLAVAGVNRLKLDLSGFHHQILNPREFVPAPAQGVLGLQVKKTNTELRRILSALHNGHTAACTNLERSLLSKIEGGCHTPLGAYCYQDTMGYYHFTAILADHWQSTPKLRKLSQSTTFGLVDQMLAELTSASD